jgi:hypothetical protein
MIFVRTLQPTHPSLVTCQANYEKLQRQLARLTANKKIDRAMIVFAGHFRLNR